MAHELLNKLKYVSNMSEIQSKHCTKNTVKMEYFNQIQFKYEYNIVK